MESNNDKTRSHVMLAKDTMVGHYRIIEKIGAGGMGEVYLAEDTELNRQVALKFLPEYLKSDEDAKSRFKREAQAAASLKHPNIVVIYEVSEFQGRPFFAMECCEGETLKQMIKKEELPLVRVIKLATQICEGLQEAHEAGIVHRDIKPSNIILDKKNLPKLVDFGLATVKGADKLTRTGSTLGTIGYMSPEQIQVKEIDHRTDLFSLGVVFYELITGRLPFKGDNEASVMNAVLNDVPEPLSRYKSGVPDELQRIVGKLLEKDPALRYQSAADVVSDLKRLTVARPAFKRPADWWNRYVVVGAVLILIIIGGYWLFTKTGTIKGGSKAGKRKMLAVLPFENLGNPDDEYFADGITDEITTRLAGLSGLGIISRTSVLQYKETDKSLKQIGKELKVAYVLEGTILWDKSGDTNRVRINPQLIRVSDGIHLWADRYDAVLTDVFTVQSKIAGEVAAALDITLLQSEQEALAVHAKIDPEAYDYYLRGKQYFSIARYRQKEFQTAERMHLKCIELAPEFAPAYTELGELYTELYWDGIDTSQAILDSAKAVIDIAFRLAPQAPEPFLALGWYYYHGLLDFDHALEAFSEVLKRQPNNALAVASVAYVKRRQGKWEEAIDGLTRVVELAPREPWYYYELGNTYSSSRRFAEAVPCYDQVIDLDPNNSWAFLTKSWSILNLTGNPAAALEVVDSGFAFNPHAPNLAAIASYYHWCAGDYKSALELMTGPKDYYIWQYNNGAEYYYHKGKGYKVIQQYDLANIYLDSARVIMENVIAGDPDDPLNQSTLGKIYAALGQKEKAIAAAKRGIELLPVSVDALDGTDRIWDLATVYTDVGEYDKAVGQLDTLLSIPSQNSVTWLKIAPEYTALHDHPGFKALIEKHEKAESGNVF